MTSRVLFAVVAVMVFVIDRVTKSLVEANVAPGSEVALLPHVWIANTHNSGAAFSIAPYATTFFLIASMVVASGLVWYVARNPVGAWVGVFLGLVMGGTIGNGYDRLVSGTVTDFVALHFWPIFNAADSAITIGVILLLAGYLRGRQRG